ncbi:G5 domain-containing protein [Ancrocorticia populi]|uniref:aggregation-promoting factor C-terminal-like domain-containing protein n=1 Tax=Ancrocorticia populi TaxID=2175228 RepID=UPI0023527428|nr:G5 domain-containing protein [Ancrocorticia populi]
MGRHSGPATSESIIDLENVEHIGPRRAALQAEREAVTNFEALEGSAFVPAAVSDITVEAKRSGTKKNAGFGAAAMIATVSLFGATGAVSADTLFASNDSDSAETPGVNTAALAKTDQPVTLTVKVDGESQTLTTSTTTVHDALSEAGIHVNSDDEVSASMSDPIADGDTITIARVNTESVTEKVTEKYDTEEVEDASLEKGEEVVETEGVNGVAYKTFDVTSKDGEETSRVETMHVVQSEPVTEVVRVGTGEAAAETESSSDSDSSDSDSSDSSSSSSGTTAVPSGDAQSIAHSMMASYGWGDDQFTCLVSLWQRESGWNASASNASSGAYGIPQALPGSKMASAGSDWQTNPATQIKWGLGYIEGRYGNPCNAWGHSESVGWY